MKIKKILVFKEFKQYIIKIQIDSYIVIFKQIQNKRTPRKIYKIFLKLKLIRIQIKKPFNCWKMLPNKFNLNKKYKMQKK